MKILCIDMSAAFLDFSMRAEAQGHEVRVFVPRLRSGDRNPVGRGLWGTVDDWKPSMKWADLILLSDNARFIEELEPYRKAGYPIFGPNLEGTAWELERGTGQAVLEAHGIACLPSTVFSNYDEAMAFLAANPARYVSKPTGDADKALSYVSKGPEDMMFMLQRWKKSQKSKVPFLFQEFTPGIEVAVGGWVGRNGFLGQFLENFEFKKLMPGEIGVNTGEMGTVMKYCTLEESKLAQELLLPLEAELIRSGYTGYIDVAVIVDKKGQPWPLEFTTRPGWPLFQIQQVLHPNIADWMHDALLGKDTFAPSQDVAIGVVVAMPDFPYSKLTKKEVSGFPVWGVTERNRYWLHPSEMMLGTAPKVEGGKFTEVETLVSAGDYLMTITARESKVSSAIETVYKRIKEFTLPNSPIYRNDIGKRLETQLQELQSHGYAESWSW